MMSIITYLKTLTANHRILCEQQTNLLIRIAELESRVTKLEGDYDDGK